MNDYITMYYNKACYSVGYQYCALTLNNIVIVNPLYQYFQLIHYIVY